MTDAETGDAERGDAREGEPLEGELIAALPFARRLGIRLIRSGGGTASMLAPYDPQFVGDARRGVLHGGVITSLLDTCAGVAAMTATERPRSVATLDLRIDYMRSATPGAPVRADAAVFRETRHVAFVRAIAHQGDPEDPVATAVGVFMAESAAK